MKSYIYKPNCKDCLNTNAEYKFTCQSCGSTYHACTKEISDKSEKLIYCEYPGAPDIYGNWGQAYWTQQFKGNLVRTKS